MVSSYWQIASVIVFAIFGAPSTFSERICDRNEQFCLSSSGGDRLRQIRQDIIDTSRLERRDFNNRGVISFKTNDIQFRREGPDERNEIRTRHTERSENRGLRNFEERILSNRIVERSSKDINIHRSHDNLSVYRDVRRDEPIRKENSFQISKDLRNREQTRTERNRFAIRRSASESHENIDTRRNRDDLSFNRNVRREAGNARNRLERFEIMRTTSGNIDTRRNRKDLSFNGNVQRDELSKENSLQISEDVRNMEMVRSKRNILERFETRQTISEPREDFNTHTSRDGLSFNRNARQDEPRKENSFQISKDLRNRVEARNEPNRLERFETRRTISELREDIDTHRNRKDLSFNRNVRRDESRKDNSFQVSENLENREQVRSERNGLERFATRRTTTEPHEDLNTPGNRDDLSFDRNVRRDEPRKENSFEVSKNLKNREQARNERNTLERFETRRTTSEPRDLRRQSSSVLESERRRNEIISIRSNSANSAATRGNDRREHTNRSTRNIDSSRARIASRTRFITDERIQSDVENRLVKPDQIRNYVRENGLSRTDISRNLYGSFNTRREISQRYDVIRRQERENVRRENREVDNNSPRLEREVLSSRRENNNLNQRERRFERGTMFQRNSLNVLSRTQEILPLSNNRRIRETFERRHEDIDSGRRESDRLLVRQQEQLPARSDNNRNAIELNRRLSPKTSLDYNNREIRRDIRLRRDLTQNMWTRSVDSVRFENDRINLESNTRFDEVNTRTRTSERRQNDQREVRRDILERNSNNRIQHSSLHILNSDEPRGILHDTENRVNFIREVTRSTPHTHDIVRENLKRYTPLTETLLMAEIPTVQMLQAVLIGFLVFKAMTQHETWTKTLRFYSDVKNLKQVLSSAKVF